MCPQNILLPNWEDMTNIHSTDNNIIQEKDTQTRVTTTTSLVRIQALENGIQRPLTSLPGPQTTFHSLSHPLGN